MNYSFHYEVEEEFNCAISYYEECQDGLGFDFASEVYSTIKRIVAYPNAWPVLIYDEVRRCQLNRFPYGVIYSKQNEHIYILAVMHLHKKPEYWKYRISN